MTVDKIEKGQKLVIPFLKERAITSHRGRMEAYNTTTYLFVTRLSKRNMAVCCPSHVNYKLDSLKHT